MGTAMAADVVIRTATPDDAVPVSALLAVSYSVLMPPSYPAEILAAALPKMTRANPALLSAGTYYVAEIESGSTIGCGGWTAEHPGTGEVAPGLAHIRHFATHPDWLGQGVGRALFDRSANDARAAGVARFECYSSLNAEGFYAAIGFTAVRPIEVDMGDGLAFPSVLMERAI